MWAAALLASHATHSAAGGHTCCDLMCTLANSTAGGMAEELQMMCLCVVGLKYLRPARLCTSWL